VRRLLVALVVFLAVVAGCRLNEKYVEADRKKFAVVAPKLLDYILKDPALDAEDREDWRLVLELWDLRIRRAEAYLKLKDPKVEVDPIWDGWEPW